MIILARNVDTSKGQLRAGSDVEGVLGEDVIQDLLKRKWAYKTDKSADESQQEEKTETESETDDTGSDDQNDFQESETGKESDQSDEEQQDDSNAEAEQSDGESESAAADEDDEVDPAELEDGDVLYTDEESLSQMKAHELKKLAKDIEIQGYANMNKAELVTAISKHFEEGDTE